LDNLKMPPVDNLERAGGVLMGASGAVQAVAGQKQIYAGREMAKGDDAATQEHGVQIAVEGVHNRRIGTALAVGGVVTAAVGPAFGGPLAMFGAIDSAYGSHLAANKAGKQKQALQGVEEPPTPALKQFKDTAQERAGRKQRRNRMKAGGAMLSAASAGTGTAAALAKGSGLLAAAGTLGVAGAVLGGLALLVAAGLGAEKWRRRTQAKSGTGDDKDFKTDKEGGKAERERMIKGLLIAAVNNDSPVNQTAAIEIIKALELPLDKVLKTGDDGTFTEYHPGAAGLIEASINSW
jgi:hypothetical protein